MRKAKTLQIGNVPFSVTDPAMKLYLQALKGKIEAAEGRAGLMSKRPTVQDLIDAGVPNADKIR